MNIATYFFIQIRRSDLKYIGIMRTGKRRRINYNILNKRKDYNLILILAFVLSLILFGIDFSLIKDTLVFTIILLVSIILICWSLWYGVWKIINLITGDTLETEIKDNGYLVCNKCNRYYELQVDESPEDFSDQCECGGKLQYQDRF
jgi:hypothetical protein